MGSPLKLALFDVDGTLVDSQALIVGAMAPAFETLGLAPPPRADVVAIIGLSLPEAMRKLCPEAGPSQLEALVNGYRAAFMEVRAASDSSPLYPGVAALLRSLAAREEVFVGVATGKSRRGLNILIETYGLQGVFHTTQVADDHPSKPNPSMVHRALAETGVEPRACVMIGDTSFDMEMGAAGGVRCLGVGWGYHAEASLRKAGAERVVADTYSLAAALDEMWEQ